jgi:hypothetical protein
MTNIINLEKYGISSVYHFTDKANIDSIENYGLQSLNNILNMNIPVKHFGAEELSHQLDKLNGLDKYVHLSFIKDHPMYHVAKRRGNIKNPVWIEIDTSVLFQENTLFCDKVANQTNSNIFKINNISKYIDFDILTNNSYLSGDSWQERKETRKAEIMVYNKINTNLIKGITNGN